jgi:hypothetical protein
LDVCPGRKDDNRHQESCQKDKKEAYPVNSDMIVDSIAKPVSFLHELRIGNLIIKIEIESKRKNKGKDGDAQGKKAEEVFPVAVNENEQNGSCKREESN